MIVNPVSSSGGSKSYNLTNYLSVDGAPPTAQAGEFVNFSYGGPYGSATSMVTTISGKSVPCSKESGLNGKWTFVMPAEDIEFTP